MEMLERLFFSFQRQYVPEIYTDKAKNKDEMIFWNEA